MSDLTTKVLIEIRDGILSTNDRLDETNKRIDETNQRLDASSNRLESVARRQVESELRVTTELIGVREAVDRVVDLLRTDRSLRGDVNDLKERVAILEKKAV